MIHAYDASGNLVGTARNEPAYQVLSWVGRVRKSVLTGKSEHGFAAPTEDKAKDYLREHGAVTFVREDT